MRDIKKLYFDLETTGVNAFKNAIHQIAFIIEINGEIVETYDWGVRPFTGAVIEEEALRVGGVTHDQIMQYDVSTDVYRRFLMVLGSHVDKFNKLDKFHLVGFNNRYFDDRFLRAFFERMDDMYFGSWFWADSLDVMVLASQHLMYDRWKMKNFKLGTVAETVEVAVETDKLHDGLYDVRLTRDIYNKITGSDLM